MSTIDILRDAAFSPAKPDAPTYMIFAEIGSLVQFDGSTFRACDEYGNPSRELTKEERAYIHRVLNPPTDQL